MSLAGAVLTLLWPVQASAQSPSEMVTSFAWIVLAVSALLVAVGALILFTKLAKLIDHLEDRLKK